MLENSISDLPELNSCLWPVPVPEMPDLSAMTGLECLNITDPIDDLGALSLHVAQLTEFIKLLRDELEALKDDGR